MDEFISTLKKDERTANAPVKIIDGFKIEIDSAGNASDDNECSSPFGCYDSTSRSSNPRFNISHRTQLGAARDYTTGSYGYERLKVPREFDSDGKALNRSLSACDGASRWTDDRILHAFDRADLCKNTDPSKPTSVAGHDECPENTFETTANTVMILDMGQKSPRIQYRSEIMKSGGASNPRGLADPELENGRRSSVYRTNPPCNSTGACVGTVRDSSRDDKLILKQVKCEFVNSRENFVCNSYQTVPLDLSLPKNKSASKKMRILSESRESNLRHETSDVKSTKESALDLRIKAPSSTHTDGKCSDKTQSPPFGALPVQALNPAYSYLSDNDLDVKTRCGDRSSGRNVIYKPIPKYPEFQTGYANRHLQPFQATSVMPDNAGLLNNEHIFGSGKYVHSTKRRNEVPWMHYDDYDMVWNYSTTVTPALMQHPRPGAYLPSRLAHATASLPGVPGLYGQKPSWCTDYDCLPSPHQRTSAFFTSDSTPQTHASMNLTKNCSNERADQQYKPSSGNSCKDNYSMGVSHTNAGYGSWSYLCPGEPTARSQDDAIYATKLSKGAGFTAAPMTFGQTERTRATTPGRLFQMMPGLSHGATHGTNLGFTHGATSRTNIELPYGINSGSNLGFPRGAAAYGFSNELDAHVKGYKYNHDVHYDRICTDRSVQKLSLGHPMMQQPIGDKNEAKVNERSSATEKSKIDYLHPNSFSLPGRIKERSEVISDDKCGNEKSATVSHKQVKPRRQNKVKTPPKKCLYSDDEGDSSLDKKDGSQPAQGLTAPARKRRSTTRRSKVNQVVVGGRDTDAALNETLKLHKHNIVSSMSAEATVAGTGRKEDTCLLASLLTNAKNPQNNSQMDQPTPKRFKSAVDCTEKTNHSTSCTPEEPEKVHLTPCTDAIKFELSEIPEAANCSSARSPQALREEGIIKKLTEIINDRTAESGHKECPKENFPRTIFSAETGGERRDVTSHHRLAKTEQNDETITVGLNYDRSENKTDLVVHDNTVSSPGCSGRESEVTITSNHDERLNRGKEVNPKGSSFVKDITLKGGEVSSSVEEILVNESVPNVTSSGEQNISSVAKNCSRDGRQYKCPDCDYRCSTLPAFQQHQSKQCYAAAKQEVSIHATDCLGKSDKFSVCQCTPCSLCKGIFSSKFRVFSHFKRGCFTKSRYCVEYKDFSSDLQQDRELVTSVRKIESIDYRLKFLSDANMNSSHVSDETRSIWNQETLALTQRPANEDRGAQTDGAEDGSARISNTKKPAMKTRKALNHGRDSQKGNQLTSVLSYNRKTASLDSDHVVSETELNDSKFEENTSPDAAVNYCIKTEPVSPVTHYEIIVTDRCNISKNSARRTSPHNVNSQGMKSDSPVRKPTVVGGKPALPNTQDITKGHTTSTITSLSTTSTTTSVSTMEEDVDVKLELADDDCDVGGKTEKTKAQDASCRPVKTEIVSSPKPWEEIESNPNSRSPRKYTSSEHKSTAKLLSPAATGKESIKKRSLDYRYNFSTTENQKLQTLWSPSNSALDVTRHVPKIYIVDKKGSPKVLGELGNPPLGLNTFLVNKRRCKRKRCQINDQKANLTFPAATPTVSQRTSTRQFDVESPLATLRVNTGNMSQNLPLKTAIAFGESQRVNKNGEKERIMYLLDANNKPVMLVEKIGKNNAKVHLPSPENI